MRKPPDQGCDGHEDEWHDEEIRAVRALSLVHDERKDEDEDDAYEEGSYDEGSYEEEGEAHEDDARQAEDLREVHRREEAAARRCQHRLRAGVGGPVVNNVFPQEMRNLAKAGDGYGALSSGEDSEARTPNDAVGRSPAIQCCACFFVFLFQALCGAFFITLGVALDGGTPAEQALLCVAGVLILLGMVLMASLLCYSGYRPSCFHSKRDDDQVQAQVQVALTDDDLPIFMIVPLLFCQSLLDDTEDDGVFSIFCQSCLDDHETLMLLSCSALLSNCIVFCVPCILIVISFVLFVA